MKNSPVNVKLVGKEKQHYLIKFPNLKVPVKVNQNLYLKMKHSKTYVFSKLENESLNNQSA
ncbi:hypothetical protein [Cognatitamlana onchidii]|uniref:hypothetical protein n=1 Tax=Cognatitamlana onchidii TaxID=2562860 RepID=UPI0010A61219|nr:hypothetical protein [Algibacter onchidii]